jgi:hypothetical protein
MERVKGGGGGDRMEPKSRRGEMLKHQEVLEVSLMTSVSPYSNSDLQVASVVKIGCTRAPFPKPAYKPLERLTKDARI